MVFLLVGGPRARQLVDDLPRGYEPVPLAADEAEMTLFDDLVVQQAVWRGPVELRR